MHLCHLDSYLKQQRESNEWTIKELADRLGFSSSYISQLENGTRVPSQKQLAILAKAYQLSEEEVEEAMGRRQNPTGQHGEQL